VCVCVFVRVCRNINIYIYIYILDLRRCARFCIGRVVEVDAEETRGKVQCGVSLVGAC